MSEIKRLQKLAGIINEVNDGEPGVDYKSDTGEGSVEKVAIGHIDNERGMLGKDLYLIGKHAVMIHKMLKDLPDSDFPHWWQSKVVKAKEYIEGAYNYLDAELNSPRETDVSSEEKDSEDPSGVS